jgi:hypothetical protein
MRSELQRSAQHHDVGVALACGVLFVQAFVLLGALSVWSEKSGSDLVKTFLPALFLPAQFATVFAWRLDHRLAVVLTLLPVFVFVVLPLWFVAPREVTEALVLSLFLFGPAILTSLSFLLVARSRAATLVVTLLALPILAAGTFALVAALGFDPTLPDRTRFRQGPATTFIGMTVCCQAPLCVVTFIGCALVRVSWAAAGPDDEPEPEEWDVELLEVIPVIPVITRAQKEPRASEVGVQPPAEAAVGAAGSSDPKPPEGDPSQTSAVLLAALTDNERQLVYRCALAVAKGPFIPDEDFRAVVGVARQEAVGVVGAWKRLDELGHTARSTIDGSLNGLLSWHCLREEDPATNWILHAWTGAPVAEIERVLTKWRDSTRDLSQPPPQQPG